MALEVKFQGVCASSEAYEVLDYKAPHLYHPPGCLPACLPHQLHIALVSQHCQLIYSCTIFNLHSIGQ